MVKEPKFDSKQIDAELSQVENDSKARSFIGAISKKSAPTIKKALSNVVPDITRITKELNKKENDDGLPELPDIGDNGNDFIKESTAILSSLGSSSTKNTQLNAELSRKITLITDGKSVKNTDSQVESIVKLPQLETTINAITTVQKVNTQGFKNVINSVYDLSNITRVIYTQELSQLQTINKSLTNLAKVSNIGGAGAISQAGSIENLLTTGFSIAKLTKVMETNAAKSLKTSWLKGSALQGSEMDLLDLLQGIQTNPTGAIAQFLVGKGINKIFGGEKIQKLNTAAREASLSIFNTLQDPELLETNKTFKKILTTGDKIANNKFLKHTPLVNLLKKENIKEGLTKLNKDIFGGKYDLTSKFNPENKVDKSTAVPFDMGTHVTINEVIPGYLTKILSAITGQPEIYNDYDSGKWMTKKELDEKIATEEKSSLKSGFKTEEKSSLKSGFKTKRLKDLVKDVWGEDAGDKSDLLSSIVKNEAIHKEDLEKLKDGKNDSDIDELIKFIDSGTFKKLSYRNAIVSLRSKYNSIKYNTATGSAKNAYTFNNDLYQKLGLSKILKQEPTNNSSVVETTSSTDNFEILTTIDSTVTEIKNILEGWWDDTTFSNPFSPSPTKPKPSSPSPTTPRPSLPSPNKSSDLTPSGPTSSVLSNIFPASSELKLPSLEKSTLATSTVAGTVEKNKLSIAKDLLTTKVGGAKESLPPITKKPKVSLGAKGVAGAVLATGGKVIKGTSSAVGKLPSKVKGVLKATSTVTGAKTIPNTTLGKLATSSSTESVTKGKATTVNNVKATTVAKDKTVKSKAKVADKDEVLKQIKENADKDEVLKQIKENAEKYNESAQKQNKLLEKENLKFLALAKGMSKGTSTLAATSKGASTASTVTKAAAKTGILGKLLKGAGLPLAALLGAGGLLLKGSTASADELTGNPLDNAVSPNIKTALDKSGPEVSRQALYMSPVGNLVLTKKYGLDPTNPSESVMNKISRWFDTLTQAVKSFSSTSSSSSSSSSGSSGSASGVPGDKKAFLKLPIDNDFGVDKTKMYAELKAKSGRVRRWLGGSDENLDKVAEIVRSNGMAPEIFFAYELQEGLSGGLGWLNHTYYTGDPYGDAKSVSAWAVATAKDTSPMNLAWVDGANSPAGPSMDVREKGNADANSLPAGSIGRMYLRGTAAAVWGAYAPEWLNASTNGVANYGDPIKGCMEALERWKGSSSSSKSSSSNASPSNSSNSSRSSSSASASSSSGGSSGSSKGKDYIATLAGRVIGSGQCYALTSQYAAYIDPQHIGGGLVGGMAAADIGKDYPWDKWGWEVVNNPKYSDLRPGDILNFKRGSKIGSYGPVDADWGHTGIIGNVMGNNQFEFYDQNPGAVKKTTITWTDGGASSIIHPPGSVAGNNSGSSSSSSASASNTDFKWKLSDEEQEKIYKRVVAKYTKAYEDSIKVSTVESSSASKNNTTGSSSDSSSSSSNDYSSYLPQDPTINGDGTGGSSTGGSSSSGATSGIIIDGNGNYIIPPNAGNNVSNTTNNYYEKVDEKVDKEKLRIIEEILNSVRLVGGYTKNNLDTIKKILEELEQSNTLLDSNNDLSETTNRLLQKLKFGNKSNVITGDVSESGSLDFLLDISPMQPIIQGVR